MRGIQNLLQGVQEQLDLEWAWALLALLVVPQGAHMNSKLNVSGIILQGVRADVDLART